MMWDIGSRTRWFAAAIRERRPDAVAVLRGDAAHAGLHGKVSFYDAPGGTLVVAEVSGLPADSDVCGGHVFGFHIHDGKACSGTKEDPFAEAGAHFNPGDCPHPQHAGDMPPLFGNRGYAWSAFFTDRLQLDEILGRAVIVHSAPDDFTTQPSGNAGSKIGCGIIKRK